LEGGREPLGYAAHGVRESTRLPESIATGENSTRARYHPQSRMETECR
jgi:hypothetical protein